MSIEMKNPNGDRCPSYGINGNGQAECYWPECGCYPRPQELRLSWAVVVERQDSLRGPFYTREAAYQVADKVCGNVRELVYGEAPPAAVPEDVLALLRDLEPALDAYERSGRKSEIKDGALHWTLNARHYDAQRLRSRVEVMLAAAARKGEQP